MDSISLFLSDSPVILPIIFTVLVSAMVVAGSYAYRVNKQIDRERQENA